MSDTNPVQESSRKTLLHLVVASVPAHYRQEMTRVADRIRDSLPPVMLAHRLDALELHVIERLAAIEAKLDEVLRADKP